jgi:uncharacterized protein
MNSMTHDSNNEYRKGFIGRNPIATFFVLACVLSLFAGLFAPFFPVIEQTLERMGVTFRTTMVMAFQVYLTNPDTLMGILGYIYHPFTPTISALIVVGYLGGWRAIRELLSRLKPWQSDVRTQDALKTWLIAIATMVAIGGLGALIRYIFAAPGEFTWAPGQFGWLPIWAWFIAGLFTDGGGVGEELGWRGFGSAFLQSKYAPLKAAVFLGLLWAFWHFPTRVAELVDDPASWFFIHSFFILICVCGTLIQVYFSNRLGGSALVGVMIHSQMNDSFQMGGVMNEAATQGTLDQIARLVPFLIVVAIILYTTKGKLAFNAENPGRRVWTWPKREAELQAL